MVHALEELRNDNLSLASWEFLSSQAKINLSRDEIASFDQALRLYNTNAEVDFFNHNKLRDSGMPVKQFEAIHKRSRPSLKKNSLSWGLQHPTLELS